MQTIYNIYFELLFDIPLALLLFRIAEKNKISQYPAAQN